MVAVERISHFIDLPAEAPLYLEHSRPSHDWPCKGTIVIEDLKVGTLKRSMKGLKILQWLIICILFRLLSPVGAFSQECCLHRP